MAPNPVKIFDTTFRDAHQSLFSTRMLTEDMLPIAEEMDKVGFWAMEVWGGATFDTMHRFLGEDPWERPRTLKKYIKNTPFSMLLRGQNLVGYRNYPDDVAEAFVDRAAENGIDIFRTFDALNDFRNFDTVVKMIKKKNKHFQGCICYSLTERRLGGPVFNLEYFINKSKQIQDMGADSLCIKDMAGLMAPYDIYDLITALKKEINIPIQLHTHYTSGMASMTYLKAVEAGVDILDTAMAPFAMRASQPAIEPLVVTLMGTPRDTGLNLDQLLKLDEYLETIFPKYRDFLGWAKHSVIDTAVLAHQIPGGMISNLVTQLKQSNALHRIDEVYKELPITRRELGTPPLVTPTSQIVGVQAVFNALFGKYKFISNEVKDLVYGLYGETPTPISPEIQEIVLKKYPRGDKPITCRPADVLEPELDKVKASLGDLADDIDDVLIGAIYPQTGTEFLKFRKGLEAKTNFNKFKTLEEIKKEDELCEKALKGLLVEKEEKNG
ncbi:MAG: pyruvate carboxylase subunit B [Deltaproteobacteria bacterium]|nr:pyruvate carboxylase subunit B [Deltaproteobacteria bacterium]